MKLIVNTAGPFMLEAQGDEQTAHHNRPSVVTQSAFISQRIGMSQLIVLGQVNDEATDAELATYLAESKEEELAIASFLEAFPVDKEAEKAKATKAPTKKTAAPK